MVTYSNNFVVTYDFPHTVHKKRHHHAAQYQAKHHDNDNNVLWVSHNVFLRNKMDPWKDF